MANNQGIDQEQDWRADEQKMRDYAAAEVQDRQFAGKNSLLFGRNKAADSFADVEHSLMQDAAQSAMRKRKASASGRSMARSFGRGR